MIGKPKPRGRNGGRPRRSHGEKARLQRAAGAASGRGRRLSDPCIVSKREQTKAAKLRLAAALQRSRDYRADHAVGGRVRIIYVERVVFVPARLPSLSQTEVSQHAAASTLSAEEQLWLRAVVREHGASKHGTLFLMDFINRFSSHFGRALSEYSMRKAMLGMGLAYVRLRSGYHKSASRNAKNVKRRGLVIPMLHYVHSFGRIVIVWSFDEAAFYVSDFSKFAWVDTTVENHQYAAHIMANDQKGKRINVSAFISAQFGVLFDKELQHHVGALNLEKNDSQSTVQVFRWFARVVAREYPSFLHVVCTDSPAIHAMMPPGACDPSLINLSDGGANHAADTLYGTMDLKRIFETDPALRNVDTTKFKLADYRKRLWMHPPVRRQLLWLEQILLKQGHLLLFHPVAHPELAPIELYWRDIKFDYRAHHTHTEKNLMRCLTSWLNRGDADEELLTLCKRCVLRVCASRVLTYCTAESSKLRKPSSVTISPAVP